MHETKREREMLESAGNKCDALKVNDPAVIHPANLFNSRRINRGGIDGTARERECGTKRKHSFVNSPAEESL